MCFRKLPLTWFVVADLENWPQVMNSHSYRMLLRLMFLQKHFAGYKNENVRMISLYNNSLVELLEWLNQLPFPSLKEFPFFVPSSAADLGNCRGNCTLGSSCLWTKWKFVSSVLWVLHVLLNSRVSLGWTHPISTPIWKTDTPGNS